MTASQYIYKSKKIMAAEDEQEKLRQLRKSEIVETADEALRSMESTPPLHELISPLFNDVSKGLSRMGKIVGRSTLPKDVTLGDLALFLSMKQQCEQDVVIPLKRMNDIVSTRQEFLQEMVQHQQLQIDQLKKALQILKERMKITKEKESITKSNSEMVVKRSASILSAARDLTPTLTKAERDYFKDLIRFRVNFSKWEKTVNLLQKYSKDLTKSSGTFDLELSQEQMNLCYTLMNGSDSILKRNKPLLQGIEAQINDFLVTSGLDDKKSVSSPLYL